MNALDDLSLVAQVAVFHNKRAFDKLVVKYQSAIRRFFLNQTLGDSQLSDDLAQETFIKAYLNIGKFKGLSSFSTWLYRIAYNVHYDYVRTQRPRCDMEAAEVQKKHASTHDAALQMDLYKALTLLNDTERTCISLQLMEGQSVEQIAKITGLVQGTVKSHLSRGKEKLSIYLRNNGYERK